MTASTTPRRGVLLLAHGARDPRWALPFQAVERRVRETAPDAEVTLCFLEFMTPGIADAGTSLAVRGCTRIDLVPLFLGGGGHVRKDVPALLDELRHAHPDIAWRMHPAIGESPAVIEALAAAATAQLDADNSTEQTPAP